jgi:colicin import membrane protein
MATAQAHSDFLPPPAPGSGRALVLALIAHGLLVLALTYAVPWHLQTQSASFSAELWAPLPMEAAPPAPAPEPPAPEVESIVAPPAPPPEPVRTAPPPSPKLEPDIATAERKAQEKKKREERRQIEKRETEQRKDEALKAEKQKAEESKRRKELDAAKAQETKRVKEIEAAKVAEKKRLKDQEIAKQQEADRLREEQAQSENLRKDARERALKLAGAAGSGSASSTGTAAQSAGPSANYGAKVVAAIRPNIASIKELSASLTAEYDVYTDASGKIMSAKIRKRSGDAYWDDAALSAILKTEKLPLDENGRVPSPMTISLRPRD